MFGRILYMLRRLRIGVKRRVVITIIEARYRAPRGITNNADENQRRSFIPCRAPTIHVVLASHIAKLARPLPLVNIEASLKRGSRVFDDLVVVIHGHGNANHTCCVKARAR